MFVRCTKGRRPRETPSRSRKRLAKRTKTYAARLVLQTPFSSPSSLTHSTLYSSLLSVCRSDISCSLTLSFTSSPWPLSFTVLPSVFALRCGPKWRSLNLGTPLPPSLPLLVRLPQSRRPNSYQGAATVQVSCLKMCTPLSNSNNIVCRCSIQPQSSVFNHWPRAPFGKQFGPKQWRVGFSLSTDRAVDLVLIFPVTDLHTHTHSTTEKR